MAQPQKIKARISGIEEHAPGLRSLVFETERRVPRFRAGQFLHLAIDPYDPSRHWPESRCFSIVNPPEERRRIRITVSQVGRFTARVMNLETGQDVWLKLPYGDFIVEPSGDRPIVLVAGGTGIAPFVSLFASNQTVDAPVRVLYGARRPELLLYSDVLEEASKRWPDFEWFPFVEEGEYPAARKGRLDLANAFDLGGLHAEYYLSGPPGLIDLFSKGLAARQVSRIHVDAWG